MGVIKPEEGPSISERSDVQGSGVSLPTTKDIKRKQAQEELKEVVSNSHEVLFNAKTVFPFVLFPDTVTIDRSKLTITHKVFFMVAEVIALQLEDILNVTAHVGPFFGSIRVHTKYFDPHRPYAVNYLWRKDALKIDRILQGYIRAIQEDIDTAALDVKELAKMLEQLGQNAPSAKV